MLMTTAAACFAYAGVLLALLALLLAPK